MPLVDLQLCLKVSCVITMAHSVCCISAERDPIDMTVQVTTRTVLRAARIDPALAAPFGRPRGILNTCSPCLVGAAVLDTCGRQANIR